MENLKKKKIAIATAILGACIFLVWLWTFQDWFLQQWYLWKISSEDETQRDLAVVKLGELRSARAVGSILERVRCEASDKPPPCLRLCIRALARIGSKAVPRLIESLEDQDQWVIIASVLAMGEMGTAARPALPALLEKLRVASGESDTGYCIVLALGLIGPEEQVLPILSECFENGEDNEVRRVAAMGLLQIGPRGEESLIEALRGQKGNAVQERATRTIKSLHPTFSQIEVFVHLKVKELPPGIIAIIKTNE